MRPELKLALEKVNKAQTAYDKQADSIRHDEIMYKAKYPRIDYSHEEREKEILAASKEKSKLAVLKTEYECALREYQATLADGTPTVEKVVNYNGYI